MLYWALASKIRCRSADHGTDTAEFLWKVTLWDMRCCFLGEYPATDWNDQPWPDDHSRKSKSGRICGPYFVAWFQWASDDEYLANYLNLPHWNKPEPCAFCNCNDSDNSWTDFREEALWQHRLTTVVQWEANPANHPLWKAWPLLGLTLFHVCIDELHNGCILLRFMESYLNGVRPNEISISGVV